MFQKLLALMDVVQSKGSVLSLKEAYELHERTLKVKSDLESNNLNLVDVKVFVEYLELTQRRGQFSLTEASEIYKFILTIEETLKKSQESTDTAKMSDMKKLETLVEDL